MSTCTIAKEGQNYLVVTPGGNEAAVFSSMRAAVNALHAMADGADPEHYIWHPYKKEDEK